MVTRTFTAERLILTTARPFSEVVSEIDRAIGHPNIADFLRQMKEASSAEEIERVVAAALGPAGFMEFSRFDFGMVLRKDRHPVARNALRLVLGNPLIMKELVRVVPDAGSYAPVTVLIDERDKGVQLSYDRMASLLAPYGDPTALALGRDLDGKVETLLYAAAGETRPRPRMS